MLPADTDFEASAIKSFTEKGSVIASTVRGGRSSVLSFGWAICQF